MPETPKVFRKKSKVKTWFNGLAREVLTGEDLPVSGPRAAEEINGLPFKDIQVYTVTILNRK